MNTRTTDQCETAAARHEAEGTGPAQPDTRVRRLQRVCCAVMAVALFLPMVQRLAKLAPNVVLAGVVHGAEAPEFSLATWFNGTYQAARQSYFNAHIGFRPYFIKTYNQLHYTLFQNIPGRRGTQIVIGKDDWLYEREYIRRYVRPGRATETHLEKGVRTLQRLQHALAKRGIAFVVVISPSKAQVYPEYIPDEHLATLTNGPPVTDYDKLVPLLERHDIRFVDSRALFMERKRAVPYPLFTKSGTHWNHYAIFFVLERILAEAQPVLGAPIPTPRLAGVRLQPPKGADRDLGDLMNLWWAAPLRHPAPYAQYDAPFRPYAERPDVLLVGDSFAFTIVDALKAGRVASKIDLLYYFKRHFDYPVTDGHVEHSAVDQARFTPEQARWEAWLFPKELVILEFNEIFTRRLGWGFPEAALDALEE